MDHTLKPLGAGSEIDLMSVFANTMFLHWGAACETGRSDRCFESRATPSKNETRRSETRNGLPHLDFVD